MQPIKVYMNNWCPMVPRVIAALEELGLEYETLDIEHDEQARERLRELANGFLSVPTVEVNADTIYVEPNGLLLKAKLRSLIARV